MGADRRMNQARRNASWECRKCGRCCSQDIPLTLYDIHRLALARERPVEDLFRECVSGHVARVSEVFVMNRGVGGACLFLNEDNTCSIYAHRPRVCGFYPCRDIALYDKPLWRKLYLASAPWEVFWEHAIASRVTQDYIHTHGPRWRADAYEQSIREIQSYVAAGGERLCVARAAGGRPMALKYDCGACTRHVCRTQTELTLLDIERLAAHLGMSLKNTWSLAVAPQPHSVYGGLMLHKPEFQCPFRNEQAACAVYPVRPGFCRFTPCHMKNLDQDAWLRFFFATGEPAEQWSHFMAARMTREYVAAHGARYQAGKVKQFLERIRFALGNETEKREFLDSIEPFRYTVQPVEPL